MMILTIATASMPLPPPPYTPSPTQGMNSSGSHVSSRATSSPASPAFQQSNYASPSNTLNQSSPPPSSGVYEQGRAVPYGQSSQSAQPHAYAPSPPSSNQAYRARSSSRSRPDGQRSLFALSSLGMRSRNAETPSNVAILSRTETEPAIRALPYE